MKCTTPLRNVTVLDCKLIPRQPTKEIDQRNETFGTIYQINSPRYFGYNAYPDNMYCVWNVADEGFVTYRIIDQKLQNKSDCDGSGCDCPDTMTIEMGNNEMKLCGSKMPPIVNQMSSDGLKVTFCSDNMHSAKGILLMAYRHNNQSGLDGGIMFTNPTVTKRQAQVCNYIITTVIFIVYICVHRYN